MRLVIEQCKALDYEVRAIHTMRAALSEESHAHKLWMNVPRAAVWVFSAAACIWKNQREWRPVLVPEGGTPGSRGVAWGGLGRKALAGKDGLSFTAVEFPETRV